MTDNIDNHQNHSRIPASRNKATVQSNPNTRFSCAVAPSRATKSIGLLGVFLDNAFTQSFNANGKESIVIRNVNGNAGSSPMIILGTKTNPRTIKNGPKINMA